MTKYKIHKKRNTKTTEKRTNKNNKKLTLVSHSIAIEVHRGGCLRTKSETDKIETK